LNRDESDGAADWNLKSPAARRLRVVLADDHPGMVEEIRLLLAPEFDVVGSASEGQALLSLAAQLRPGAVVADIHMPRLDGMEAGRRML
jgi:DNA-binding NarL/FixJ family response regulator